jgi:hypothetical protein
VGEERQSAGKPIFPNCELIEVHVAELKQLFRKIDPAPFHDRDLMAPGLAGGIGLESSSMRRTS